jgi:protein arginine kinase activator
MEHICPLTGLPCLKPKIYQITEVENNKFKKTMNLCEDCFLAYINKTPLPETVSKVTQKEANEFVQSIMNFVEESVKKVNLKSTIKKPCPKCHATIHDLTKTGKLGCAECWDWYFDELRNILYSAHGSPNSPENLVHKGKIPNNFKPSEVQENLKMKLIKLKYKLAQAVKTENYEMAAQLRDIIKKLEKN